MIGAEPFKAMHRGLLSAFDDLKLDVMQMFAEGNLVSGLCEFSMTRKNTGERVECLGNVVLRIEDDKIAEGWNRLDFLDLVKQCGTTPSGSFPKMLADNAVG